MTTRPGEEGVPRWSSLWKCELLFILGGGDGKRETLPRLPKPPHIAFDVAGYSTVFMASVSSLGPFSLGSMVRAGGAGIPKCGGGFQIRELGFERFGQFGELVRETEEVEDLPVAEEPEVI